MAEAALAATPTSTDAPGPAGRNWALWIGATLVALSLLLAGVGPWLAPTSPTEPHYIIYNSITKTFIKPPLAPFIAPNFPLGTDALGRDLLSQLLWAVRPTLILGLLVAAVRLLIGLTIGALAGWWPGRLGTLLELLIALALAPPVLLVALCVVAALSITWGMGAFVLGLTLTGWAEAASLLRTQMRLVKGEPYIEAVRALGANEVQLLLRHGLPQALALIWILLVSEVSSTLMVTAGLGFLGYYMHVIWVPLEDWSALRASGRPELAQLLATGAGQAYQQPWQLLVAGSCVFLIVLGFNLLGEGLRRHHARQQSRQPRTRLAKAMMATRLVVAERAQLGVLTWRRNWSTSATLGALVTLALAGGLFLWQSQRSTQATGFVAIPGDHLWATARHDAQATRWTPTSGPTQVPAIAWAWQADADLGGGPVVAADGTLYVAAQGGTLTALTPTGAVRWQLALGVQPFGTPALLPDGTIAVLGRQGEVVLVAPTGQVRRQVTAGSTAKTLTNPLADANGTVYYVTEEHLVAVTSAGNVVWQNRIPSYSYIDPVLRLSEDGQRLYFEDIASNSSAGKPIYASTKDPMDKFIIGANGQSYLAGQAMLATLRFGDQLLVTPSIQWDPILLGTSVRLPQDAGVLPDGRLWIFYAGGFEYAKLIWVDTSGQPEAIVDYTWEVDSTQLIGLDGQGLLYTCGRQYVTRQTQRLECMAHAAGARTVRWKFTFPENGFPVGGALAPGRLYVATAEGRLYALAANPN